MRTSQSVLLLSVLVACDGGGGGDKDDTGADADADADTDADTDVDWPSRDDLVLSSYDGTIYAVDVTDVASPELVTRATPGYGTYGAGWPDLNPDRSAFYFSEPDGIYSCDAPDCAAVNKVTPDWPKGFFDWLDVSPVADTVVFQVSESYPAGAFDVYAVGGDGTGLVSLWAFTEHYVAVPNGDTMQVWGSGEAAVSPDGTQVAIIVNGHCGAPKGETALCANDFYSMIMVVEIDGSGEDIVIWSAGEGVYTMLQWAGTGRLYYWKYSYTSSEWTWTVLDAGVEKPLIDTIIEPITMSATPFSTDDAVMLCPFNTGDLVWYDVEVGSDSANAAGETYIEVADPDDKGSDLSVFTYFRWAGWE